MTHEELNILFPEDKIPQKIKQSIKYLIDELDLIPMDCIPDYLVEDYYKKMKTLAVVNNIQRKNMEEYFRKCSCEYKKRKKANDLVRWNNLQLRLFDDDIIKLY